MPEIDMSDCPCCDEESSSSQSLVNCEHCIDNSPYEYLVEIAGITNELCANCGNFNGGFVVTRTPNLFTCQWKLVLPNWCGAPSDINFTIGEVPSEQVVINAGGGRIFDWKRSGPSTPRDCNFNNLDIPFDTDYGNQCNGTPTAKVTAIL